MVLFVCSLCNYLWYPSVLRVSYYDTAFGLTSRELLLQLEHTGERGVDFSLALSVVDGFGKLYQADTLWLLKTME